jgi:N-methylhydantoinase A
MCFFPSSKPLRRSFRSFFDKREAIAGRRRDGVARQVRGEPTDAQERLGWESSSWCTAPGHGGTAWDFTVRHPENKGRRAFTPTITAQRFGCATRNAGSEVDVWTVDIDVGGTLTDGLFTDGESAVCAKVDSTPHDLTVCLFDCLAQGATKLGFADVSQFLESVALIRWSTTITSNVLAEQRGPRLGLLVSQGHDKDLYGKEGRSGVLDRILLEQDVTGLSSSAGETEIMKAARLLLESGVRRICVSLKGAHLDPGEETGIKRVIDQQYPDHFLGSVPVLAGSDVSKSADDSTRTYCALINAYTHSALAAALFKAEDELRETSRYAGTFLVSHTSGGVAGVAKTRAIDTIESGPILGLQASANLAREYGLRDVIAMDIGGTTAKIGVLRGGESICRRPSDFFGIPLETSFPYLRSIALGGGSVVRASADAERKGIQLGPESMGAFPGPACYGLGGDQATLTDAFVVSGLINPRNFLGGTKPIDAEQALRAIQDCVAGPLGVTVEEACQLVVFRAFEQVSEVIASAEAELQIDAVSHTLFAYGGNGGLFACGVAERAGIGCVQVFALGPVFSAFGSSVSDICHVYERAVTEGHITDEGAGRLRRILEEIKAEAAKDLLGEGIRPVELKYTLEFEAASDGKRSRVVSCAESALRTAEELSAALAASSGRDGPHSDEMVLELFRVRVKKAMPQPHREMRVPGGADGSRARTGTRRVFWGSRSGEAQLYRWESLEPGNRVAGCALLEGENTTYLVPDGWSLAVDGYGNARIERI